MKPFNIEIIKIKLLIIFVLIVSISNQSYGQNLVIVENQKITINDIGITNYTLGSKGELRVSNPSTTIGSVNFTSDSAWLILDNILPSVAIASHLSYISINGQPAVNKVNVRVTNYLQGCVIIPHAPTYEALSMFKDAGFAGDVMICYPEKYYKSADFGSFDNTISSFKLKKGYMATFAQYENGSGYSKVYIAENEDIEISTLPVGLNNLVSFVRVFPWRYSAKKGFAPGQPDFNRTITSVNLTKSSWFYHWGTSTAEDVTDYEFVPMKWNAKSFTDARWKEILDVKNATHVLGFNEPQSVDQGNMSTEEQLLYWPKMMESGLRLGSPAPTNMALFYDFMTKCDELNYRVDFVALHDYGEGTALSFYNFCKTVHDRTGRPIWVTEFSWGGSWTNSTPTYPQISQRINEIIEKYDTEGIIERYCIFNFDENVNRAGNPQNRSIFYTPAIPNYTFTPLGEVYRDNVSPMAFNRAEEFSVNLKLVAPQNLTVTNNNGLTNILDWDNFNFTGGSTTIIERSYNGAPYTTIAQINSTESFYNDDITTSGFGRYIYRLSSRELGFQNSKFVIADLDVNPNIIFNVALNKSVFASSVNSATTPASLAVDGNIVSDTSRWVTKSGELPAYIEIDLNGSFLISELKFYSGYQGYNSPITSFVFQYWNIDRWEDLVTETTNTISQYSKTFTEVRTNKVRLNINSTTSNIARFYEIEVYGRIGTLGTNDFKVNKFIIYPNPTSNMLNIIGDNEINVLQIFDINGKNVITKKNSNSVDVQTLSTGNYYLKLNNKETVKFIKE
jgi:hypothetical protein